MKTTATREEVRAAFLVDDLNKYLERVAQDLNEEIDRHRVAQIIERVLTSAKVPAEPSYILDKLAARIIKGTYILGYLDAIRHHDVAAREAYADLFEISEGGVV